MRILSIFFTFLLAVSPFCSTAGTNRAEQKRIAESEHIELRKKLTELKQDILDTESAKQRAEDALADSEAAISTANRKLVELSKEQIRTEQELVVLVQKYQHLQQQIKHQKEQLATLLRQQYETGSTDRVKLLLSGDNRNRINRELHYLSYLSQSQNKLINQLHANLDAVEENRVAAEQIKHNLDEIAVEQKQQKTDLLKEKIKRADVIKQLSNKLFVQRKEAGHLQKNEQRLAKLVNRLNIMIDEQRKIAQEKRRAAAAKEASRNTDQTTSIQNTQTPEMDEGKLDRNQFAHLKGRLRLPVKGELVARYGSQRGEGTFWKGVFIQTDEGTPIKSVASGKVIFAEWLRGFGNLIILDHGAQYMSIYGNNQALLKQAGDTISTGETIATAGNSGGNEQSGLYFELRFQGKPFDPLSWINLK